MSWPRAVVLALLIAAGIVCVVTAGLWALTAGSYAQCASALTASQSCDPGYAVHLAAGAVALMSGLVSAAGGTAWALTRRKGGQP